MILLLLFGLVAFGVVVGYSLAKQKYGFALWRLRDEAWDAAAGGADADDVVNLIDREARATRVIG